MLDMTPLKALNKDPEARRAARAVLEHMTVAEVEVVSSGTGGNWKELVVVHFPPGCKTCGDQRDVAGLAQKCRDWHAVCNQCGERFDGPRGKGCRRRKHSKELEDSHEPDER